MVINMFYRMEYVSCLMFVCSKLKSETWDFTVQNILQYCKLTESTHMFLM